MLENMFGKSESNSLHQGIRVRVAALQNIHNLQGRFLSPITSVYRLFVRKGLLWAL